MKKVPFNNMYGLHWEEKDLCSRYDKTYVDAVITDVRDPSKLYYTGTVYITSSFHETAGYKKVLTCLFNPAYKKEHKVFPEGLVDWNRFFIQEDRPNNCISNIDDSVLLYSWNPARQWKKGVCSDNSYLWTGPSLKKGLWSFEVANTIFYPRHCETLGEALNHIKIDDVKARAINNIYWLAKSDKTIQLFRRRCCLGTFMGKKFFPTPSAKYFYEEIMKELPTLKGMYA